MHNVRDHLININDKLAEVFPDFFDSINKRNSRRNSYGSIDFFRSSRDYSIVTNPIIKDYSIEITSSDIVTNPTIIHDYPAGERNANPSPKLNDTKCIKVVNNEESFEVGFEKIKQISISETKKNEENMAIDVSEKLKLAFKICEKELDAENKNQLSVVLDEILVTLVKLKTIQQGNNQMIEFASIQCAINSIEMLKEAFDIKVSEFSPV
ncbi:hypothetical protein ACNVED_13880 [Legionella sp. D16C41]|uniref:hypothetical protein n=1 Tax=Legionella sp. D16C41 TaxID=3402688 RepID=UPI003AF59BE3